ncbi:MAG TPA: hypothetical protein VG055_29235 [Planctomycetaceae bacterium]|nr:hypothetical protein [Planctomycetaceae bacterium]
MRSDQRYLVREAIRREQGEPAQEPVREPMRRDAREYERYQDDEPPRREVREYERREYREPPPHYREPGPVYTEPGPGQVYSVREPGPVYADREPEPYYSVRQQRPAYSVREPEPHSRRDSRPRYPAPEIGSSYGARESTVRRSRHDRPQRPEDQHADEQVDDDAADLPLAPAWFAVTRATAFFLGCVTLLNLIAEMRFPHFSAAAWWIDLHFLPKSASRGFLSLSAVLLVAFAFFPRANGFVRRFGALCTLGFLGAAGWTVYRYYRHDHAGQNPHELPIPFALHVAALLLVALPGQVTGWWERTNFFKDFLIGMMTLATCAATFPLALFFCVGQVDDRGPTDAAAVFAGRSDTDKNGDDKPAANPFRTALQLYREGQIKKILLIARPTEPGTETTQTLRRAALAEGIAEADLLTLPAPTAAPNDSRVALAESAKFLDEQKLPHVLIVARFFEVPRIRLALERAGLEAHSMPIREDVRPAAMRAVLFREAAALWKCYLHPVTM